jgi:hypothetical protein
MIFGKKINAEIWRAGNRIFPDSTYPVFTVRSFLGDIFSVIRPVYGTTTMFGNDIVQLREVFADWPNGLENDEDRVDAPIIPTDLLVVKIRTTLSQE